MVMPVVTIVNGVVNGAQLVWSGLSEETKARVRNAVVEYFIAAGELATLKAIREKKKLEQLPVQYEQFDFSKIDTEGSDRTYSVH